jgi:hypothetical protein
MLEASPQDPSEAGNITSIEKIRLIGRRSRVSPANIQSTDFSIIIITLGLAQ